MQHLPLNELARVPATPPERAPQGRPVRPAVAAEPAPPAPREIVRAVAETLAAVAPRAGALEFQVDQGETVVRVVDRETKQLVRQIPSEEMVAIRRAIDRVQGILIRSKA